MSSPSLSDALTASRNDEYQRAARALLRRPIVRVAGQEADAFTLIRRHASELRAWFDRNTGWRLLVDSEVARLVKTSATTDDHTHPARDVRSRQPFGRRRYVLSCLALAVLERATSQITLGRLAEQVVLGASDPDLIDAGITFTLQGREERGDLVSVVRLLLDLGVLSRVAGDEEAFVKDTGDVLYDVERRVLAALLATPRGPSTVRADRFDERLAELTSELPATTDDLRNQRHRHRLTRWLLDEPVLYYAELDEAENAYLTSQRAAITARISELTGLIAEVRAEGIAMVDPFDDLTDVRMPESGTEGHLTLLLAEYLAGCSGRAVPIAELQGKVREYAVAHRAYWRRNATEPGAETELTTVALARLEALRLIRWNPADVLSPAEAASNPADVTARPALSRYALAEPTIQKPKDRR